MKITLESTKELQMIRRGPHAALARLWRGETDEGTRVIAWITLLEPQTHDAVKLAVFEAQLVEVKTESVERAIDLRFIL